MNPLPPLVPADCDLRGLPWMPVDTVRLLDSDLFALSTGEEFKAAVALWCKAWQQVPAASLPSDDRVLAHLSGAGARWKKVKEQALRGFVTCSDGRLYHPVIAEKALEAWSHRIKQRERASKRWHPNGNATAHATASPTASPTAMQGTGTGTGQDKESSASVDFEEVGAVDNPRAAPLGVASPHQNPTLERSAHELAIIAQNRGVTLTSGDALCLGWADEGVTPKQLADAIAVARVRKPAPATIPPRYLVPILEDMRNKTGVSARAEQPWYATQSGIEAKAREAGIDIPDDPSEWQGMKVDVYKRNGVTADMVRAAQVGAR